MLMRLNKRMAELGLASRREADELIRRGLVRVNGVGGNAVALGMRVRCLDNIEVVKAAAVNGITVVFNKPIGVVSAHPEPGQVSASFLLEQAGINVNGLAPCGRLDRASRGLLVLSSDGVIARRLISPTNIIDKEYLVCYTGGQLDKTSLRVLRSGRIHLDGVCLKPIRIDDISQEDINKRHPFFSPRTDLHAARVILCEGRKHQLRRMFNVVRRDIVDLHRVRIGPLSLWSRHMQGSTIDDKYLGLGSWRVLSCDERNQLLRYEYEDTTSMAPPMPSNAVVLSERQ